MNVNRPFSLSFGLDVDLSDPAQTEAFLEFVSRMHAATVNTQTAQCEAEQTESVKEQETPKPTQTRARKSATVPEAVAPKTPENVEAHESSDEDSDTTEEPKSEASSAPAKAKTHTVEDVRALLAEKVDNHRAKIKAKLTELGAPNVSSLDPSKYEEIMSFLSSL